MIVDLATAKAHLRVSSSDEDTLIELYMDAAEKHIVNFLDDVYLGTVRPEDPDDWEDEPTINADDIPSAIKAAQLLLIADLYENREAQSEKAITENPAVVRLLYPYRINLGV